MVSAIGWTALSVALARSRPPSRKGKGKGKDKPEKAKAPSVSKIEPKTTPKETEDIESMEVEEDDKDTEEWAAMSPAQLKTEVTKPESLSKQMGELNLSTAAKEVETRLAKLRRHQQTRLPDGQRLDMLGAALKRATVAKEKAEAGVIDLRHKSMTPATNWKKHRRRQTS